jgi:hypothetical protein
VARDRYGIKFTKSSTKRIAEVARYVEQQPRSRTPDPNGPSNFGGLTMLRVTTALRPMVAGTPGTGEGKIQKLVSGSYTDFSTTVYPILNDTSFTVAVAAFVLCGPGPGGNFHMVTVDKCSNLTTS